jgi:DNA-binding IclR family transcriptional regulator
MVVLAKRTDRTSKSTFPNLRKPTVSKGKPPRNPKATTDHVAREPEPPQARGSSQTADRALSLLKIVAVASGDGMRLSDIASQANFDRATTHRLLASLMRHGLVEQDLDSKRYRLGLELFALAAAASNRYDVTEVARAALHRLSKLTGDTSFFCLRSGNDLFCIDVETGSYPIKTLPLDIGSKRPLGLGSAGVAALAHMPESEIAAVLARHGNRLAAAAGVSVEAFEALIARARMLGYAVIAEDPQRLMIGVAVALINRRGRPQGTLSVTGLSDRMAAERESEIAALLVAEARAVEDAMWHRPDDTRHMRRWRTIRA